METEADFCNDPDFGEPVTLMQPGVAPVVVNAVLERHAGADLKYSGISGIRQSEHSYDVIMWIGRSVCPVVKVGATKFLLTQICGEEQKVMRVGAILYNDNDSFKLGLVG